MRKQESMIRGMIVLLLAGVVALGGCAAGSKPETKTKKAERAAASAAQKEQETDYEDLAAMKREREEAAARIGMSKEELDAYDAYVQKYKEMDEVVPDKE